MSASSVVIVGAGVFGASLAHRLASDGWDVTLVERDGPAGPRATSRGASRVLRNGHGPDAWHARLSRRSRALWLEIQADAGEELFVETGVAWLARREGGWESASEAVLGRLGIPVARLDPGAAARLWPSVDTGGLAFAILEPTAGILRATRAVTALVRLAAARGARLVDGEARVIDGGGAVGVGGAVLEADRVVWACGPWLAALFPGVVRLSVERAEYATFAAGAGWGAADGAPVFVDVDREVYGLPALDGEGFKVAPDGGPPEAYDPDTLERPLTGAAEERARAYLRERFPALAHAPRTGGRVCQYEMTADSEFLVAPLDGRPHAWIVGGGSGHGFKNGPALAEVVREQLTGAAAPRPRQHLGERAPSGDLFFGPGVAAGD